MNPFLLPPDERLSAWKTLRAALKDCPDDRSRLAEVAHFWAKAPFETFAHDPEKPDTWPTIWEMIHANDWSRDSLAIAMAETLRLAGFSDDRLELRYVRDQDASDQALVLIVDECFLLNYRHGQVIETNDWVPMVICAWRPARRGWITA